MKKIQTNTLSLLKEASGLATLNDFKLALLNGEIESAKRWLQFIVDNKIAFCMISKNWDNWLRLREDEIIQAEKTLKAS